MISMLASLPSLAAGGTIKASATPTTPTAVQQQALAVPVTVDISDLPEKLGSYTATLRWDSRVLKYTGYQPGSTIGFSAPVVNNAKASDGLLTFAAANPHGAQGNINILNVMFEVIGSAGDQSDLKLNFSAMAAASTYNNMMSYLQTMSTGVERRITIGEQPKEFALLQNYPNPFNPSTKIGFGLPKSEHVMITVFNTLGQNVRTLVDEQKGVGNYVVMWDGLNDEGKQAPAGVYLYRLQAGGFSATKQMMLIK